MQTLKQYANAGVGLENILVAFLVASVDCSDGVYRDADGICGASVNISQAFGEMQVTSWVHLEPILAASGNILEA